MTWLACWPTLTTRTAEPRLNLTSAAPDTSRWLVLGIGVLAQMMIGLTFFPGLAVVAPEIMSTYRLSLIQVGLLFGGLQLGPVLTIAFWGLVADHNGDRFVLVSGLGLGSIALAATALAPNFPLLLVALTVASMFMASANVASTRAAAGWFAANQRGLALGIRQMSVPIGGVLAALLLPGLSVNEGMPATFVILAVACFAVGFVSLVALNRPFPMKSRSMVDGLSVWRDRRLWRLAIGVGLLILCQNSMLAYLVVFLTEHRGMPLTVAAAVFLTTQLLGAATRVVLGRLSDRVGRRVRPMRWIALSLSIVTALVSVGTDLPITVVVPLLMIAAVLGMSTPGLAYTASAEIAGLENAGAAIGLEITLFAVAGTFAPVMFGLAVTLLGWHGAFAAIALFAAGGWLILRHLVLLEDRGWLPGPGATALVAMAPTK